MQIYQNDELTYKGTRILIGNDRRKALNEMVSILLRNGYTEMFIPVIQKQETFKGKVGQENNNLMFNFTDRGGREICLAPEYTAVIQKLSTTEYKLKKDVKLFYIQECFRGEKPQAGRFRQFTQLGVEILNPSKEYINELIELASSLINTCGIVNFEINKDVSRGLDYYENGKGFEITCDNLGSSKQICGGGAYEGGIGFAIGIDRVLT